MTGLVGRTSPEMMSGAEALSEISVSIVVNIDATDAYTSKNEEQKYKYAVRPGGARGGKHTQH